MSFTNLSTFLWRHALLSAIHLLNKIFFKSVPTTPYELWYSKKLSLGYLKIWGYPAHVKLQHMDKLEARSLRAHFIGYPKKFMKYYFYLLKDHNVIVNHHAVFLEKKFI